MSDQFRHICSFVPHCILYHHNGSMSSLFFRVGIFSKHSMWGTYGIVTDHECDVLMSSNVQCDVLMSLSIVTDHECEALMSPSSPLSSNVQCDVLMSYEEWQTEFSDCSVWDGFVTFGWLGGFLLARVEISRRSRSVHLDLWSIIWYSVGNKLTSRGMKHHVSLGNVYH
jgi:hypothetical protein